MEQLPEHEMEVDYRYSQSGIEVQFVWNSLLSLAYSKVHDHRTNEKFSSIAPECLHPIESFKHPYRHQVPSSFIENAVALEPIKERIESD